MCIIATRTRPAKRVRRECVILSTPSMIEIPIDDDDQALLTDHGTWVDDLGRCVHVADDDTTNAIGGVE